MEDKAFLMQQIEFLEFQLEDMKNREKQQKYMYESMINSLAQEPAETQDEARYAKLQEEHISEIAQIEANYKEHLRKLENSVHAKGIELDDLRRENINIKSLLETHINSLKNEIHTKNHTISEFSEKLKEFEQSLLKKDNLICYLKKEIEENNNKFSEELMKAQSDENLRMSELKSIYEGEKKSLQSTIFRLESDQKSATQYFALLLIETETHSEKLANLTKILQKIFLQSKQALTSIISDIDTQTTALTNLPLKDKLDLTEKMLKFSASTQDNFMKIKNALNSLKRLVSGKEEKEKNLKDTIIKKNQEIEILQRSISIKACENNPENCKIIEDLIRKDTEISSLKRIIGELRESDKKKKPPVCTPQHKRAKTLDFSGTLPYKLQISPQVSQLNLTALNSIGTPEKSDECYNYTTSSTDRVLEEKLEAYEQKIYSMKLTILKLKNQRDRAKNLSEKLLLELKQRKLDLAILQENFAEQQQRRRISHNF